MVGCCLISPTERNGMGLLLDFVDAGEHHLIKTSSLHAAGLSRSTLDQRVVAHEGDEINLLP